MVGSVLVVGIFFVFQVDLIQHQFMNAVIFLIWVKVLLMKAYLAFSSILDALS